MGDRDEQAFFGRDDEREPDFGSPVAREAAGQLAAIAKASADKASTDKPLLRKWKLMDAITADPDLNDRAKVVAHALLGKCNLDIGEVRIGYARLALLTGKSNAKSSKRAVDDLVRAGWLEKKRVREGLKNGVNIYRPKFDRVPRGDETDSPAAAGAKPAAADDKPAAVGAGSTPKAVHTSPQSCPEGMDTSGDTLPPKVSSYYHSEDSVDIDSESESHRRQTAEPFVNGEPVLRLRSASPPPHKKVKGWIKPELLDHWWNQFAAEYHHKPGLDRAKGTFCQLLLDRVVTIDELLAGLERYNRFRDDDQMAYANATRWLFGERWKDEPALAARAPERRKTVTKAVTAHQPVQESCARPPHDEIANKACPPVIQDPLQPRPRTTIAKTVNSSLSAPRDHRPASQIPERAMIVTPEWRPSAEAWEESLKWVGSADGVEDALTKFRQQRRCIPAQVNPDDEWHRHIMDLFPAF